MRFIIYDPKTLLHNFFINCLKIELDNILSIHEVIIINTIFIDYEKYDLKKDILLIFLNPQFLKTDKDILNEFHKIAKLFILKIQYITEPLDYLVDRKVWENSIKIVNPIFLWTYSHGNIGKLATSKKIFKISPKFNEFYNFSECIDSVDCVKKKRTDKIIFIGNPDTESRQNIIKEFGDLLIIYDSIWDIESWKNIIGENLFFLNIHRRNNSECLETFRIIPLLSNDCIVLSDIVCDDDIEEYCNYNIFFEKKEKLLSLFLDIQKNINHQDIYEKMIKFRNTETMKKELFEKNNFFKMNFSK
jgi:hypothetical protein